MKSIILLLLCLRISIVHVQSAKAASFLPTGFKSWFWPTSIVVGDWLYLHGGEIHYSGSDGAAQREPNPHTFAIDLTKSWTTSNVTKSYGGAYYGATYGIDGNFALYEANVKPEAWGFTPSESGDMTWSLQFAESITNSFILNSSVEYALTTSTNNKHYSLGGTMTYLVEFGAPRQMVMEEFVTYDYATQKFTNKTHIPHSFGGEAHFVPQYGEDGVLLFLGGKNPSDRSVASEAVADLGSVQVYDIHTGHFYAQETTSAPIGRYSFCSVGASSSDNSSYEIFIYAGNVGFSGSAAKATVSKAYILTLPAFHRLEEPAPADSWPTDAWRDNQKCQKVGQKSTSEHNQRQMLSVGGYANVPGKDWSQYVEPWSSSMKIFNLSELTWGDTYNPNAIAYTTPDIVDKYYLNNERFPSTWGDDSLKSILNNSAATTTPKTSTPEANTSEVKAGNNTSVGAIAGGVVGGVVVAALVAFLLFWFCWRDKRKTPTDYFHDPGYESIKGQDKVELPVGRDMRRRELPGDDMHRRELPGDDVGRELPGDDVRREL